MSGYFPAQHGVKYTLEIDMPAPRYPQVELSTRFRNLASVAAASGYTPVYKGKFHCNKPANGITWVPEDVNKYGFTRWDPPDAGADQTIPEEGGGIFDNDGRFMNSEGTPEAGTEGAVQYLRDTAAKSQPFFMVVSLVNPHDVLLDPKSFTAGGYDDAWLEGDIELPATAGEDLSTKPTVQAQFRRLFNASSPIPTPQMKRNYLNFYGNLMRASDAYLVKILDTLRSRVARGLPAHTGGAARRAGEGSRPLGGGRLLRSGPAALGQAAAGLRRLHVRRLAVRAGTRALSAAAEPHREHPRAPLQDRPLLRRRR
jgi:arylsulfatase A-like enzyme